MKQEHQLVSNPLQNWRALCKLIQYGIVEYILETCASPFKFMCRLCSFAWNKPSSLLCNFENKMEENAGVGGGGGGGGPFSFSVLLRITAALSVIALMVLQLLNTFLSPLLTCIPCSSREFT